MPPTDSTRERGLQVTEAYVPDADPGEGNPRADLGTLVHLAAGFQYREEGVADHIRRIATYVEILARGLGVSETSVQLLRHASVLHDAGMVDVPEATLRKKGALTPEETDAVKGHTTLGRMLLNAPGHPLLETAADIAWTHHERWDGSGYPRGLSGEAIPVHARILGVADVFDALTTRRPFKEPYPFDVALELIQAHAGTHFDPRVVDAFVANRARIEAAIRELSADPAPRPIAFRLSDRDALRNDLYASANGAAFSCPYCHDFHPRDQDHCPVHDRPLEDIHKLSGTVLDDKYHLLGAIGTGGMGVVYEAVHTLIGRRLAVKILSRHATREKSNLSRFYNEARVFAEVGHPNLVEVTDMGRTPEAVNYFVMELLDGCDLHALLLERGRLPWLPAVSIAMEVLRTLDAVHARGIVHRDLKPENIFLVGPRSRPRLKLLDFGISLLNTMDERAKRLTQPGVVFGTPVYMSPEQARGRATVDARSDLFTVGVILFEMLTGDVPFDGDSMIALQQEIADGRVSALPSGTRGVPAELDAIVLRPLAYRPEDRYASAREFRDALAAIAARSPDFRDETIASLEGSSLL